MEQSRETFESLQYDVETSKKLDELHPQNLEEVVSYFDRLILRLTAGSHQAEQRLQEYLKAGQAEGRDLNATYDKLKQDVYQAKEALDVYAAAFNGIFDPTNPDVQRLQENIESAAQALETFEVEKLGMELAN